MTPKEKAAWALLERDNRLMIETQEKLVKQLRALRRRQTYTAALREMTQLLEGYRGKTITAELVLGMIDAMRHPVMVKGGKRGKRRRN